MTQRLDAVAVREYTDRNGETKSSFSRIGVAFEGKNGGWQVLLDAMPAPADGQFKILLMVPKPREGSAPQGSAPLSDDVPW